jgi:hypothetical protein
MSGKGKTRTGGEMTVVARPRVMSALPPRTRIKKADVQGGEAEKTGTSVTGRKRRNIDGIARQGHTRATGQS